MARMNERDRAEQRAKQHKGVRVRSGGIQVFFTFDGKQRFETLDLAATPANVDKAAVLLADIKADIKAGTFVYSARFPNSKHARSVDITSGKRKTIGQLATTYLAEKSRSVRSTTYRSYESKVRYHIMPKWENVCVDDVTVGDLKDWREALFSGDNRSAKRLSNKMVKEVFAILQALFDAAQFEGLINANPCKRLERIETGTKTHADPLTRDEVAKLEATAPQQGRESEKNMIMFNVSMGLRASELIAMAWEDIDLDRGCMVVRRSLNKGEWAATKEIVSTRLIPITRQARVWLERQAELITFKRRIDVAVTDHDNRTVESQRITPVWVNSRTGKHHDSSFNVNQRFLTTFMKKAGVRYRPMKQLRHTFASQALSGSPEKKQAVAAHMGHSDVTMLNRHYTKELAEGRDFEAEGAALLD